MARSATFPGMKQSVLVTGSGTGLGLETALYLAEQGYRVYATVPFESQCETVRQAAAERGVELRILLVDITDQTTIDRAISTLLEECGGIYALVNNAAIALRGYFEDLQEEEIRNIFGINVLGTMAMIRAVLPHMRRERAGRVVIITSIGGRVGSLAVSAYCSTKFAQEGFGESLAQEVKPFGIYVSLIEPSIVATERFGINRGFAKLAFNPNSPYVEWFRTSQQLTDRLVRTSPTRPVHVAQAVHRALTARRPRLRYVVGRRAWVVLALRRLLPDVLFERLYFDQVVRQVTNGRPAMEDEGRRTKDEEPTITGY
ncbi:MAG: SDR family oxidoreductase [Ardenticatenaceae bacterium]